MKNKSDEIKKDSALTDYLELIAEENTIKEIAEKRGIEPESVKRYFRKYNLHNEYRRMQNVNSRSARKEYLKRIIEGKKINNIAETKETTPRYVSHYFREKNLENIYYKLHPKEKPQLKEKRLKEKLDKLVEDHHLNLKEIGDQLDISREKARQEIIKHGKHERYKQVRDPEFINETFENLVNGLVSLAFKKSEGDKAAEKVLEYNFSRERRYRKNFEQLRNLFSVYFKAKEEGEKKSLKELKEESGVSFARVGDVLKDVGEEPLHGSVKMNVLSCQEQEIVKKAIYTETNLNYPDMEKITGIPRHFFSKKAKEENVQREPDFLNMTYKENLTRKEAFDFFKAREAGFDRVEAREYAEIKEDENYSILLEESNEIKAEINQFLDEVGLDGKQNIL